MEPMASSHFVVDVCRTSTYWIRAHLGKSEDIDSTEYIELSQSFRTKKAAMNLWRSFADANGIWDWEWYKETPFKPHKSK